MPMLVAGLLLLWLASFLLRGFVRANPAAMSRHLRRAGGYIALGFALFMMVRGEFNLAFGAALFGFWMLGTQPGWVRGFSTLGGRRWMPGADARALRVSRVRTAALDMMLDRNTGRIWGQVVFGPQAGRALDELSATEGVALHRWCEIADPEGARVLETYLDRRFAGWRETADARGHAGAGNGGSRRDQASGMSEREAGQVLGVSETAEREEITQAHRRMMKKYHPDHGGSTAMAARVNEAKDVLMRRHQ